MRTGDGSFSGSKDGCLKCFAFSCRLHAGIYVVFAAMVDPSHAQRRRKINHDQDMDGNTSFDESLRSSFASVKQCELIFF